MNKIITLFLLVYTLTGFSQNKDKQEDNTVYSLAGLDEKPVYPEGLDKLKAFVNESYLKAGYASEKKGKVYALFIIEKDGSLSDVKILRGIDLEKGKELVRILSNLPKWTPGKQHGQPVRVLYTLQLVIGT